ncbi:MAG: tRNA (adenosine(37)-N6)-dimethylallyltransferase MiaA [Acidimicrobiales bacterium]
MTRPPLVIVGPTAAGKSSLALQLALAEPGSIEIVSADAMAVYRTMDVGTAKPSPADRALVPHHLVDVVDPTEDYAVSRFADEVVAVLDDLERRSITPVLVGGTGLYVRAVVDGFDIPPQFPAVAAELDADPDTESLWLRLRELDPAAADKMLPTNRRRIVRALEVTIGSGQPFSSFGPGVDAYGETRFAQAGLEIDRDEMDRRIDARYDEQMAAGFLDEVANVRADGWSKTAAQALGYKELAAHLDGECSLDDALDEAKRRTRRFARRQQRWFRRDPRIRWFDALAPDLVEQVGNWWGESAK